MVEIKNSMMLEQKKIRKSIKGKSIVSLPIQEEKLIPIKTKYNNTVIEKLTNLKTVKEENKDYSVSSISE